jgi:hypothetical protein
MIYSTSEVSAGSYELRQIFYCPLALLAPKKIIGSYYEELIRN